MIRLAMTDFSKAIPFNPEKTDFLHARGEKPAPPGPVHRDLVARWLWLGFGLLCVFGFVALAFTARAGWENHREWVVALTLPFQVLGGMALGYLAWRKAWWAAAPGILLLTLVLLLTVINIAIGAESEGPETSRDVLSILQGVFLGITIVVLLGAAIRVEWTSPAKMPAAA